MARETPEERERRLAKNRERQSRVRAAETESQRSARLSYLREYRKHYAKKHKLKIAEQARTRYAQNRDYLLEQGRCYRVRNRDAIRVKRRIYLQSRPAAVVASRLRHRVYLAIRKAGARKSKRTIHLTGCTNEFLASWLESQFSRGMTWENAGEWHIDHILPCAAFDIADEGQQEVAFHYTNLRPLWGKENAAKKDRLPVPPRTTWTLDCIQEARRALGVAMHVAEPK